MDVTTLISGDGHPGGRAPAPGALRLVQDFVNSVDRENGADVLDARRDATAWLEARNLGGPPNLARMRELREALRALLADAAADPAPLDAAARAGGVVPDFTTGTLRADGHGLDGALGTVVAAAFNAMADGTWSRLKICPRSVCRWAFYDRSPNRGATWCSMALCGNRTKVAAHYARSRNAR